MFAIGLYAKTAAHATMVSGMEHTTASVSVRLDLKANIVKKNVSEEKNVSISAFNRIFCVCHSFLLTVLLGTCQDLETLESCNGYLCSDSVQSDGQTYYNCEQCLKNAWGALCDHRKCELAFYVYYLFP